jgi:CBS domain-containing protein
MLVVFNALPAFPMDGGRVLRALLAMRMDYVRATQIAAGVGQAMAVLFAFFGLFGIPGVVSANPFLVFIALFVWLGASQEASMVQMRSALTGIPVMRAMITDFRTLRPDDPLSRAIEFVVAGFQEDFPVVDGERLAGILTKKDFAAGLAEHGPESRVGDAMQTKFITVSPREMLQSAFAKLQDCECHTLPVVQDGQLLGLVTADNLAEVLMIQEAMREANQRRAPSAPTVRSTSQPAVHPR